MVFSRSLNPTIMKTLPIEDSVRSYVQKYEASMSPCWDTRHDICLAQDYRESSPESISVGVSYIRFFIATTCFRIDILGSALVEFI